MTGGGKFAATLAAVAALAACATLTERTLLREIQDSSVQATSTLGRVAVVAIDPDAATRKAWEDAFAARLSVRGVTTSTGDGLRGGMSLDAGAITVDGAPVIEAARKAGAEAILFIQPPRAVPIAPGGGAYRWMDARSSPDPRTDLDTTPASVTEVRLYSLKTGTGVWRAMVLRYYPGTGAADAPEIAASVVAGIAKRGYLR